MARIVRIKNTLDEQSPLTYLSVKSSVGTALYIRNPNAFEASWGVQIGKSGEEKSEVLKLGTSTPSGTTLNTIGTILYDHPADTPVYAIKYNQLIFKRSTVGTSGTATVVTDGTVTIQADNDYTQFNDSTGATGYAYKAYFYNSSLGVSEQASSDSDWLTDTGYSFYSLAKMRDRVKNRLYSQGSFIKNDSVIDDWINEWMETMTNTAIDVNKDYLLGTVDVAHGTGGLGTITSSDFKEIRRVWYTTDGVSFYNATKMDITDFNDSDSFNETHPYYYMQGDSVIGKKPTGNSGTVRLVYYKMPSVLDDDTDEIPVSMRSYTRSFIDYGVGQAYIQDNKLDEGKTFLTLAEAQLSKFEKQITPRSKSGPEFIEFMAPLDGTDNFEPWYY